MQPIFRRCCKPAQSASQNLEEQCERRSIILEVCADRRGAWLNAGRFLSLAPNLLIVTDHEDGCQEFVVNRPGRWLALLEAQAVSAGRTISR